MGAINRIPNVLIHRIVNGSSLTGVAPTGVAPTDSEETIRRGRYRKYAALSDGGLVDIAESVAYDGFRVKAVHVLIPGMTAVAFSVVDREGHSVGAGSVTLSSGAGYMYWADNGVLVPPGCKFKAVGTGAASADGEILFVLGEGWGSSVYDSDSPGLGVSNRPPSR